MISIDTNVFVRAITDDIQSPEQTKQARQLIQQADKVYISQIVQIETVWVLERAYQQDKATIIQVLKTIANSPIYQLQNRDLFLNALQQFSNTNAGFADTLINVESQQQSCILWTFDKKLAKQSNTCLLNQENLILSH